MIFRSAIWQSQPNGSRSLMAAQAFRQAGYEAYSMAGGLVRWRQEGRPIEPVDGHVADH